MPATRPPGPRSPVDKEQAFQFLKLIDPGKREFTFQTFAEKGDPGSDVLPRIIHSSSLTGLRREHDFGAGIYVVIGETDGAGRKAENITRIRAVWQEDDDGYAGAFPIAPSMIVQTSPGHFHRYWLVEGAWPADEQGRADFAAIMERMVETYASDKSAKDISRVLRVPGFFHRKADPHLVRIVEASGKRYTRAQLVAAFPPIEREPRKEAPRTEWRPRHGEDERIRKALDHINPDDRDVWLQVGMALKDELGDAGRSLWDQWSRRSDKFDERDQDKTWRSFRRHDIKIGTLFHYAKQNGWTATKQVDDDPPAGSGNDGGGGKEKTGEQERTADATGQWWKQGAFSAKQLQAMTFDPIAWVLPQVIPAEGLTLLCAKPKFGKSWFAYDLCIAATMDRFTLGTLKPAQGDVLYCALEDSKRRLQRRMQKLLPAFNGTWPDRLTITTKWRRLHEGGLDDIRSWHAHTKATGKPILAVIDVLAKVRRPTGNRPAYEADYEALTGLAQLANELGIAIIVIHHTRKMAADDLMETVSGSFGLTGAVDTILVMANKASGAVLDVRGRDVESAEFALQFNKDACRWTVLGAAAEVHVSEQRAKILAALKEADAPMTVAALMEATWLKRNPLDVLLGRMAKAGDIKRIRTGLYAHKDWTPPPQPEKPGKDRSVVSVLDRQMRRQMNEAAQTTEDTKNNSGFCPSVASVGLGTSSGQGGSTAPQACKPVTTQTDQTDRQIAGKNIEKATASVVGIDLSGTDGSQTDQSVIAANGYAISATPEERHEPEPGQVFARVWIKEVVPVPLGPPGDSLDDFV
jgi:hypothetical protein